MAGNIFLYLDGIPGESYAEGYLNWIDIADFSLGVTMAIDQDARTGGGVGISGAADPQDLECSTKLNAATPVLLQCCAVGVTIPRAKLIQCNVVNEVRLPVSEYSFGDSIISNVSVSGSGGGIPDLSFSLNYGSIKWRYHYYKHDNPSKALHPPIERGWSLLTRDQDQADPNAVAAMSDLKESKNGYDDLFTDEIKDSLIYKPQPQVDAKPIPQEKWNEEYGFNT